MMRARWTALAFAVVALVAAGCGGDDDEDRPVPLAPVSGQQGNQELPRPPAPKLEKPGRSVAAQLDRGVVGVVGLDGRAQIRPKSLEFASDATLEDVRWSQWGGREAVGRGQVRLLECDPTCARGKIERFAATVRLLAPRTCSEGQFYDRAEVRLVRSGGGPSDPASFIRAPC